MRVRTEAANLREAPGGLPGHVGGEEGLEDDGSKSTDDRECYQDEGGLVVVAETMPLQTNLLQQQQVLNYCIFFLCFLMTNYFVSPLIFFLLILLS